MQYWSDTLKLGKGSAFVKRDLRLLPLTDSEFEADFWFHAKSSTKRREVWLGMVLERESGAVLAMKDVDWPPPTVNDLATLLAHELTGDKRYEEWHRMVHDWSYAHFQDPIHGEWFGYLHRDGTPANTLKGGLWKGPFHYPRQLYLSWRWLA